MLLSAPPSNRISTVASSLLPLMLLLVLPAGNAQAEPWGPWSASTSAPVILSPADRVLPDRSGSEQTAGSIAATPFFWMLGFYQNVIGPVNSGRCSMYPTCSQYSVQAIRKHGPAVGIIMTADRLIHELDEQNVAPLVKVGNRYRYEDTVSDNDFWWYTE
jgi:putative component of membrane protein insertase Oxa1/YidC/SpoIIIJ protein YidD